MMNRWVALACGGSVGVLMLFAAGPLKLGDMGMKEHTGRGPPVLSARALSDDGAETMPGRALSDAPSLRMQSVNQSRFITSAAAPDGKMIFVTETAHAIVIFDPANGNFETIDISEQIGQQEPDNDFDWGSLMFRTSVTSADGKIILVPSVADVVGIFDPASKTLELVDIDMSDQLSYEAGWKFEGGALAPNNNIVFAPSGSHSLGVFDPASKDLELVNIQEQVSATEYPYGYYMFSDAVGTPEGKVIFVPLDLMAVGIFDSATSNFEAIDISAQVTEWQDWWWKFGRGILAPTGKVIFAPMWAPGVGIFDPASKTLELVDIMGHIEAQFGNPYGNMFRGAALAPGGKVVFAPAKSRLVGVFDTSTSTFEAVNISEQLSGVNSYYGYYMFSDAVATPDGAVIFAPNQATQVGIFSLTTMTTTTSMLKLKLKLKVKGGGKAWLKVKVTDGEVKAKAHVKSGSRRRRG